MSQNEFEETYGADQPEVSNKMSSVSTHPKKNILIIAVIAIVGIYVIYSIAFGTDEIEETNLPLEKQEIKGTIIDDAKTIQAPIIEDDDFVPPPSAAPSLPEPPPLIAPEPPKNNIPEPIEINETIPSPTDLPLVKKNLGKKQSERLTSAMLIGAGKSNNKQNSSSPQEKRKEIYNDERQVFEYNVTDAEQVQATKYGITSDTVAQGKIIDAVLETSINTDLAAPIRAIVSRNIYAESGKKILVPRGSRLVGQYDAQTSDGVARISIIWDRLIRPDGIDLKLASPALDRIGRGGVAGILDNKFYEILRNSILVSALKIGIASASNSEAITNTNTTSADGSTTSSQSGTARNLAIKQAIEDIGQTTEQVLNRSLSIKPRIIINQGTIVKVFVNRDLLFPVNDLVQ